MKGSGITRRIDELGRIVVPKEIRYNLGIRDGEPLEIYTDNNAIIIKKFSQMENIKDISQEYIDIISDVCNIDILVSDREKIIASSSHYKNLENTALIDAHKTLVDNRESYISNSSEELYNISGYFTILPIITSNDSCGLVLLISTNLNDSNIKYAKIIKKLIVNKIDVGA